MPRDEVRPFSLDGRVALITGASRGIGLAISRVFAAAGASLYLVARTEATLERAAEAAQEVSPHDLRPAFLPGDIADRSLATAAVAACIERFGRLDILVNNAGQSAAADVAQVSDTEWDRFQAVNLTAPFVLARAAVEHMRRARWGRIINIASISGQTGGLRAGVHYGASKAGLIGMTKTLARDLAADGITANAIAPGQIETAMGRLSDDARSQVVARIPMGRIGASDDIAYAALYLASEEAGYITGHTLDVNGGINTR